MKRNLEQCVEEMLIEHYEKYYRLAYSYVHNEMDAQDIVQEGAYKAILKCNMLKHEQMADTWIYRIMINEAIDFIRKNKRDTSFTEVDKVYEEQYGEVELRSLIDLLGEPDKSILILRFFEGRKLDQIAAIVGISLPNVKNRLYRTLDKLRISIEDWEVME